MVVGSQLTKIDGLPPQWDDLLVVEDEIVVLTSEPSELWWFDSFGLRRHYPIDPPSFSGNTLTFASPQGVAIQSQLDGQQSVRTYGSDGPAPWAAGISRKSVMMFVNRPDLWYLYVPNWSDPPLLYRARMLEDADL